MPRSIHDNYVLGYSVDVTSRSITVRTEKREHGRAVEYTDIRFEGVLGYLFRDSLGGILTHIHPVDWAELRLDYAAAFDDWDKWAWPFQGGPVDPAEHARAAGATAFQIDSAASMASSSARRWSSRLRNVAQPLTHLRGLAT